MKLEGVKTRAHSQQRRQQQQQLLL